LNLFHFFDFAGDFAGDLLLAGDLLTLAGDLLGDLLVSFAVDFVAGFLTGDLLADLLASLKLVRVFIFWSSFMISGP